MIEYSVILPVIIFLCKEDVDAKYKDILNIFLCILFLYLAKNEQTQQATLQFYIFFLLYGTNNSFCSSDFIE